MTGTAASGDLTLFQDFQQLTGSLKSAVDSTRLTGGKLRGELISFNVGGTHYSGKVAGDSITGTAVAGGSSREWSATRVK